MKPSFGMEIVDNISAFLGNESQERRTVYTGMAENFKIADLEDSDVSKMPIDEIVSEAKKLLEDFSLELPEPIYCSHIAIKKLGQKKRASNQTYAETESIAKTALHMAHVLAAYDEDITLHVACRKDSRKQLGTNFIISSNDPEGEAICSMIRSVYGQEKISFEEAPPIYPYQGHASGRAVFPGKGQKKGEVSFDKMESWVSALLTALPSNHNFTASIRFCPLSKPNRMLAEQRLSDLAAYYNKLRFYSELNWNNSASFGGSKNRQGNFAEKQKDTIFGDIKTSETYSQSFALSGHDIDKQAQQVMERIEYEMERLSLALDTAIFGVCISLSAENINTFHAAASILSGTLEYNSFQLAWEEGSSSLSDMVLNRREILPLLFFPTKEFCGFSFAENEEFSLVSQSTEKDGFQIADILWNSKAIAPFYISSDAFCRHAFICGMTGSGKTNTLFHLIGGLQLPFCVIEPVKGEYRALKSIFPELQVLTMKADAGTKDSIDMMQINPFWFPQGASLAYHIDSIKTIISSAFELSEAMPNILEQCLYNVYIDAGWDIVMNRNIYAKNLPEEYLYPTFQELCREIETYLDQSDYSEEVKGNYKGALLSRIKSFVGGYKGILLNTTVHPDYESLMKRHCVIELEGLADDADKCLVMGTILVQYYQYLKCHLIEREEKQKVQHLIVIEEAHRLFKNSQKNKKTDGPDAVGQLVDLLSNMMAEIRAFGEGMLIVDQSPTKIAEDVIKNSASKIMHRIDNGADIKVMQSSMLLPEGIQSFSSLQQGEALIRTDSMVKPCKVKMLLSDVKEEYTFAFSFQSSEYTENRLSDIFLANSILSDERVYLEISDKIYAYLNSLALSDCKGCLPLTDELMCQVIKILKKWKKYDAVAYLNVLFEVVSLAVKRIFAAENRKDFGMIHLFIMRMLLFYKENRGGRYIKAAEVTLLRQYMEKNLLDLLFAYNRKHISKNQYSQLCRQAALEEEDFFASILCKFVNEVFPALVHKKKEAEITPELLIGSFLENEVLPGMHSFILEKYDETFGRLDQYLKKVIVTEKEDSLSSCSI